MATKRAKHYILSQSLALLAIGFDVCTLLYIAVLLILASQRIEVVIAEWFDNEELKAWLSQDVTVKRGATPTMVEWAILSWVAGNPFSALTATDARSTELLFG